MNGKTSLRGYLLQTIVCLFDTISVSDLAWEYVVIEPDFLSEKVDIAWFYPKKKKVIQVKSSQNQIGKSQAIHWALEIENSLEADEYELILLGPCSQSVIELGVVGKVKIPFPKNNDVRGLLEQASHKLDLYFEANKYPLMSPSERELIVASLVLRLEEYSTLSLQIKNTDIDAFIRNWHSAIFSDRKTGEDKLDLMIYRKSKNLEETANQYNISPARLKDILIGMQPRHSFVIEAKYGLIATGERLSPEETADLFNSPVERIEELEKEALDLLKREIKKQKRKLFIKAR